MFLMHRLFHRLLLQHMPRLELILPDGQRSAKLLTIRLMFPMKFEELATSPKAILLIFSSCDIHFHRLGYLPILNQKVKVRFELVLPYQGLESR